MCARAPLVCIPRRKSRPTHRLDDDERARARRVASLQPLDDAPRQKTRISDYAPFQRRPRCRRLQVQRMSTRAGARYRRPPFSPLKSSVRCLSTTCLAIIKREAKKGRNDASKQPLQSSSTSVEDANRRRNKLSTLSSSTSFLCIDCDENALTFVDNYQRVAERQMRVRVGAFIAKNANL